MSLTGGVKEEGEGERERERERERAQDWVGERYGVGKIETKRKTHLVTKEVTPF